MIGRSITFTFGNTTLNAADYSITAKDKLMQLTMANGIIRTVRVGKAASQIKISGLLPAHESSQLLDAMNALIGAEDCRIMLDGAEYENVMLDLCSISPSQNDGFAQYTLEFHF